MFIDHIEDDPNDRDMVTAYVGYGTKQQIAYRMERAMILEVGPEHLWPNAFADPCDGSGEKRCTSHGTYHWPTTPNRPAAGKSDGPSRQGDNHE